MSIGFRTLPINVMHWDSLTCSDPVVTLDTSLVIAFGLPSSYFAGLKHPVQSSQSLVLCHQSSKFYVVAPLVHNSYSSPSASAWVLEMVACAVRKSKSDIFFATLVFSLYPEWQGQSGRCAIGRTRAHGWAGVQYSHSMNPLPIQTWKIESAKVGEQNNVKKKDSVHR
jgi:hypothetical protein